MGLISTFKPDTTVVEWIMYQVIGGTGRGAGLQIVSLTKSAPPHLNRRTDKLT